MKTKSRTEAGAGANSYAKAIIAGSALILIFVLGYYSGYRRVLGDAQAMNSPDGPGKGSVLAARNSDGSNNITMIGRSRADGDKPAQAKPAEPERETPRPRRVEDLPPNYVKRFREAEQFVNHIPEIERELLAQHPLLEQALRMGEELQQSQSDEELSDESRKTKEVFDEWVNQSSENQYKADIREAVLKLDTYLELLDDPEYTPFIEDGLTAGSLSEEISRLFERRIQRIGGIEFEGVHFTKAGITRVDEFRREFRRFADEVKSRPENQFALERLPVEIEQAARQRALDANRKSIIWYYKKSLIPEELADQYNQHYRTLESISFAHFLKPVPPEVAPVFAKLKESELIRP